MSPVAAYLFVALLGIAVGAAEVLSRYTESPLRSLGSPPAVAYVGLNGGISALALYLLDSYGATATGAGGPEVYSQIGLSKVLVAGLGSLALIRSSFALLKVDGKDVSFGMAAILQTFLDTLDRAIRRKVGAGRMKAATMLMQGLDAQKVLDLLPSHCVAGMKLEGEASSSIAQDVAALQAMRNANPGRTDISRLVAFSIMKQIGQDALETAVRSIRNELT